MIYEQPIWPASLHAIGGIVIYEKSGEPWIPGMRERVTTVRQRGDTWVADVGGPLPYAIATPKKTLAFVADLTLANVLFDFLVDPAGGTVEYPREDE
jgi:hypothetical protein